MTLPDAALALRPEACSACRGPLDPLGRCARCGAVFGEAYRCPLCLVISDVEPASGLYLRCRTCGGPRFLPHESKPSDAEVLLLRTARSEQLRAGAFRAGSGFALASGVLSLFVTTVVLFVTSPAAVAQFAALTASLVPFLLAIFALRQAGRHGRQMQAVLQQAWVLAASRLVLCHGGQLGAAALARELGVDEARAELLLAEVSVQNFVSDRTELPARMRVTELADANDEAGAAVEVTQARADGDKP